MIGKTFIDAVFTNKYAETKPLEPIYEVNDDEINNLKKKIKKCDTTVEIDTAIKEAGLQNVANLSAHIKELRESGQIDTLDKGYVNDLIKTQNYTNIAERAHGFTGVSAAIKQYNGEIRNNAENTAKFADIMGKNNSKFASYIKNLNGAKASIPGYSVSLIGAKIKTLASNTTTMAVNMAMSTIAGAFVSWGIGQVISLLNQSEEAIQKAAESASELSSNLQSLDDYKTKITELKTALDSNTLSYTEAQAKRQELMRIQDEIIDKYGNEASGINLVTGSIEKQGKAIDDLKAKEAKSWIGQNVEGIDEAKKDIDDSGRIRMRNLNAQYSEEFAEKINKYKWAYSDLGKVYNSNGAEIGTIKKDFFSQSDYLTIEYENYYDAVKNFNQLISDLTDERNRLFVKSPDSKEYEQTVDLLEVVSDEYKELVEDNQESLEVYEKYIDYVIIANPDYSKSIANLQSARQEYEKSIDNQTPDENIDEKLEDLNSAKDYIEEQIKKAKSEGDIGVAKELKMRLEEVNPFILEAEIRLNKNDLRDKIVNTLTTDDGKSFTSDQLSDIVTRHYNPDPENPLTDDEKNIWERLNETANAYGVTIDDLINKLEYLGLVHSQKYNDLKEKFKIWGKDIDKDISKNDLDIILGSKIDINEISDFDDFKKKLIKAKNDSIVADFKLNGLSGFNNDIKNAQNTAKEIDSVLEKIRIGNFTDEDLFAFITQFPEEAAEIDFSKLNGGSEEIFELTNQIKNLKDERIDDLASKFKILNEAFDEDEAKPALNRIINSIERLKNASGSEVLPPFASSLKDLNKFSEGLSQLDKIYADIDDKGDFDFNSLTDDKFIETFGKYTDEYENFVNTINQSPDDIDACQSAFNNLVAAWFNGEQIFKNLSEETKNATIAYLEQNGVMNASAIVTDVLTAKTIAASHEKEILEYANNALSASADDTTNSIYANINSLLEEAGTSETARLALLKLVAQQTIFNNTDLNVIQKINALRELASQAGTAGAAIATALNLNNDDTYKALVKEEERWTDGSWQKGSKEDKAKKLAEAKANTQQYVNDLLKKNQDKFNALTAPPIEYTGGPAASSAKAKGSGGGGSGGGSKKEHETNDEYYNYYQARADDLKNGAEELEKEIEEIGAKIESAYKKGDTILAESLKKDLSDKQREYKDYLAKNAKTIRDMANSEILPIVYKIAPEFAGKTIDEFTDTEKLKVKERLDNEILARKNKIIDLENAGKSSDGSAKVSDSEVKSAERQLKILEELYTTLENIYDLAGNSAGQGEWAKKFRETIDNEIDKIKDDLDKNIDEREFKLSLFEDMGNDGGQLSVYRKMLQDYHSAAEEYRAMGVEEDSEAIKETQKGYRDAAKNIFELLNDTFDKFMDKRNDLSDNIEFKIDNLGDKEYGRHISLLEDEIALRKDNIAYIVKERNRLLEAYKNSTIAADEYEKRQRSLNDLEKEQVKSLKEYYETKRDIIMSQIDGQIDNITEATEKQTKAIDKQIDSLEKENDELNKLKDLYDKAYKAVQKIVDDETDALDKLKEQEEEYWNAKLDALEKMNEETKRGIELTEKKQAVEKAGQKTALVYHEDKGWTYEANPNELSEAQRDLDQWLIDDQFNQAKKSIEEQKEAVLKSIDEQIEGWNNYLELWGDAADAFEEEANDAAAKAVIGLNYSSQVLAQNTGIVSKYEKEYTDILRKIGDETSGGIAKQINDLEKQREAIEENSDAVTEALENEKKVWEELFSQGMIENVDAFVSHLEEKLNLVIGSVQGARELIQAFSNDMRDFVPHASELIPYNDEDIITIKQMYQNSGQWAKSNSQKSKDQLFARNEELSKQLSFSVRFDSHTGAWLDDNGNNIYGRLSENNDTAQRNTEAETENTYTIEGNTKASENNTKFLKSSVSQNKKLTSVIEKTTDTIEDLTDSVDSLSKNSGSLDRENNTENSNGNNSQTGSSLPSSSTGSPYTYSAELGGADIDTAKKWFADKHKTYPGSKITVVGGGVSSLSSELMSELGLKNGDLAVVGKRLYYITSNGYNKITDSLVNKYAKGCEYIPCSQTAVVDEEGDGSELLVHKDMKGRPKYLERGSEVVSAGHTRSLTSLLEDIGNSNVINALRDISGQYNPIKRIADSFTKAPDYIMGNNQNTSTVNNNYIDKVVLEQVNNVDDMFRGLTNMAMQRAHKRV